MIALIISCIALFIYCVIAERRIKSVNDEVLNLRLRLRKEGIECD